MKIVQTLGKSPGALFDSTSKRGLEFILVFLKFAQKFWEHFSIPQKSGYVQNRVEQCPRVAVMSRHLSHIFLITVFVSLFPNPFTKALIETGLSEPTGSGEESKRCFGLYSFEGKQETHLLRTAMKFVENMDILLLLHFLSSFLFEVDKGDVKKRFFVQIGMYFEFLKLSSNIVLSGPELDTWALILCWSEIGIGGRGSAKAPNNASLTSRSELRHNLISSSSDSNDNSDLAPIGGTLGYGGAGVFKTESVLNRRTLSPAKLHLFLRPLGDRSCRGDRLGRGERLDTSGDGDRNLHSVTSSDASVSVSTGSCSLMEPNEWSRCCTLEKM
ncbi:hypothetical protein HW555_008696 [Spodoptera exigua]|uniref:Uncharacterized protein n=1 Tax=Spodoptera exigua TaxID=7107 RepID=A0A835GCI7_SPOEX|nr:hypothetical protein HW555_008696 [Spodoptera exigua]